MGRSLAHVGEALAVVARDQVARRNRHAPRIAAVPQGDERGRTDSVFPHEDNSRSPTGIRHSELRGFSPIATEEFETTWLFRETC